MPQAGAEETSIDFERLAHRSNAAADTIRDAPDLKSVLSTSELNGRPSRPPDLAAENRALIALATELATSPHGILRKLANTALALCQAHSAGISLLSDDQKSFHWPVIVGEWARHLGGGTPRDYGPCGTVLDRNVALLFSHPERDFSYFAPVTPLIEEALLIPFYVDGEAVGTIWVIAHDHSRRFDAEDLRVMTNLATFAGMAYQTLLSLNATLRIVSIVESSDDAVVSKDLNGIIATWNKGAERLFGYTAEEVIGKPVSILIPPDRQEEEPVILERIRRGARVEHYETVRRRKDGSLVDISLTISPIKNAEGSIIGASKIARDITERKRVEEHVKLLAQEVDHRSKNLLALVQATVHLTQADTVHDLKAAIEGRIRALANAHGLLAQSRWAGADLHRLVTEELSPYCQDHELRARVTGPSQILKPDTAQSIAMMLHELTTNAVKYGALSAPAGTVRVEWSLAADGRLVIRWSEAGGPAIKPPKRQGFGMRAIEKLARGELRGEVGFDWRGEGLACEIALSV
jgi:PAS domain S-box-containing protein